MPSLMQIMQRPLHTCAAGAAVNRVELDVSNLVPIHMILDQQGAGRPQIVQGHQAVGCAHRAVQPAVVVPQGRQLSIRLQSMQSVQSVHSMQL